MTLLLSERDVREDIREGEPGKALARYQAHGRLHIHDTRQEAMQAMVDQWNDSRKTVPDGQAVMITDSSNTERDQLNASPLRAGVARREKITHRYRLRYGIADRSPSEIPTAHAVSADVDASSTSSS